jgi:hypothetical protein
MKIASLAGLAGLALLAAGPALAQTGNDPARIVEPGPARVTTPGPQETIVEGEPRGVANGGPGSTGTIGRSGLGADNTSNNTAGTLNARDTQLAFPTTGGNSGDGGQ